MPGATVPENTDTRLTRVEERTRGHAERLVKLADLPSQYAVLEERLGNFGGDLNDGLKAIRDELGAMKKDTADRFAEIKEDQAEKAKERRTMLIALFIAGVGLFGTFGAQLMQLRGGK